MQQHDFKYDNLYTGTNQVINGYGVLAKGYKIKKGTVLGLLNTTGELHPVDKNRYDSVNKVYAIANDDFDSTNGECNITIDFSGFFNVHKLIFINNNTAPDHRDSARIVGIFF